MEKKSIITGKTLEEAKANVTAQLGLDADSYSYQVVQMPKSGFLGFGAQPAKIEVTYEVPDPVPEAPKVALSSASRSKPKPVAKKPEAPKPEAPKAAKPAEALAPTWADTMPVASWSRAKISRAMPYFHTMPMVPPSTPRSMSSAMHRGMTISKTTSKMDRSTVSHDSFLYSLRLFVRVFIIFLSLL